MLIISVTLGECYRKLLRVNDISRQLSLVDIYFRNQLHQDNVFIHQAIFLSFLSLLHPNVSVYVPATIGVFFALAPTIHQPQTYFASGH